MNLRFIVYGCRRCSCWLPALRRLANKGRARPPLRAMRTGKPGVTPAARPTSLQNVGDRVFFEFDKSDLTPEGRPAGKPVAWLKKYPNDRDRRRPLRRAWHPRIQPGAG